MSKLAYKKEKNSKYILFDTETTGFYEEDRIIEVGAMIFDINGEVQILDELCNTDIPIKSEATLIHKISKKMIEDKCVFTDTKFYKILQSLNSQENYLIAHNMPFDLGMLEKEGFISNFRIIDTLRVAKHFLPENKSKALPYLRYSLKLYENEKQEANKYNITLEEHTAIGDVLVTKLLFEKLKTATKKKFPNDNVLEKMEELTKTPILLKTFIFGKYKGKKIEDIYNSDIDYINWMQENIDIDLDMKYTLDMIMLKK